MGLLGFAVALTRARIVKTPYTPVIKFACFLRGAWACFEKWRSVASGWNFFRVVYIKTCELNYIIFASIIYHITICSCAAVKTRLSCVTCYISKRQVTWPQTEAIFRQNNTLTTSKILKFRSRKLFKWHFVVKLYIYIYISCIDL